ncbi:acetate--CoA ligase family protein [Mycobacterium sp.]|uniref:acetate--CoA ligase family protein n=1 Tax=Mycobacterium sp. TaxID=1785 RepID=UPI002CCDF055|nr:acetate--CoA ligase family protein [Mycobacterium sp.]HKP40904.1 acetate--CoA ligase family protein [Mycobacterium sp.]
MTGSGHRLERIFTARSVAIVGASETGARSRNAVEAMAPRGITLHLVNRRGENVMGRSTSRSLTELAEQGVSVDVALVFTNSAAAVDVTAEASALEIGGVIVNAGGFAEAGPAGRDLQDRLVAAAGSMPVIGPNCNGIVAPGRGLHLAGSPPGLPISPGRLAFVTHSGATMMPMGIAGVERRIGYSYLVSTGNEAVVDMAEVIDYLSTDDSTNAVCLLIETIRNPAAFWTAVDGMIAAGKPVLALKNGRSSRGQAIAKSHTGAVAGESWIYETALRQHGVIVANDLVDLADRAVLFDQVAPSRWTSVAGLAIASGSGGMVTMASDVCAEEGIDPPPLEGLRGQINEAIPGATVVNPLDLTGAAMIDPRVTTSALRTFLGSDDVDTVLVQSPVCDGAEDALNAFAGPALDLVAETDKLLIVGSFEGGPIGKEVQRYLDQGIAVTRGLRATVRALKSMADFVTFTPPSRHDHADPRALPAPSSIVEHPTAGRMLDFAASMELLASFGVPVAPYAVIGTSDPAQTDIPFDSPYVVKLADVPHRSDIGAVRLNVAADDLAGVVKELRSLAEELGESSVVVVQPQYRISSELLVGVNSASELGPLVVCGLGGIFVEVMRQVVGRLAPFDVDEAARLVRDVNVGGVLDGPRGSAPWPKDVLAQLLRRIGDLAVSARPWLESLDINPVALTPDGIVAVDALVLLRDSADHPPPNAAAHP